ncbi:actin-related protein 9-like [Rhodamnia argentea]|uniref:Actin-related protein 9-like n=1 Tax=Rhodamnia argentea TaxID=178133 RepID=A0ABM3HAC2_9MYRT|nr:actin-related protein 9-like [Rhodamnia argentea]
MWPLGIVDRFCRELGDKIVEIASLGLALPRGEAAFNSDKGRLAVADEGWDYLKTAIPSQLISERGSNLVVINPGSANIRVGLAQQDAPFAAPHCIARCTSPVPKRNVQDQMLNSQVTTAQHMEREKAYDIIASLLKIPFLDEEVTNSSSFQRKMGRVDAYNPQNGRKDSVFSWTDVYERQSSTLVTDSSEDKDLPSTSLGQHEGGDMDLGQRKYRPFICGEEALKISPTEPYCFRRPIRSGHFNISQDYPVQQGYEDLHTLRDWMLVEKLHIPQSERNMYSAILVVPETFDNRVDA